jgi:hypothetical protein
MNDERSLDEINAHRYAVLEEPEDYRVVAIRYEQDLEAHVSSLALRVRHETSGHTCWLRFANAVFKEDPFFPLRDATGLYLMTTSHLGMESAQQIEIGDWDGGPPLFWAEDVSREDE